MKDGRNVVGPVSDTIMHRAARVSLSSEDQESGGCRDKSVGRDQRRSVTKEREKEEGSGV